MRKPFLLSFLVLILLVCPLITLMPVYAADSYTINIDCDEPYYYLKGQNINVYGTANGSIPLTLSIYWNWKTFTDNILIYQNTKTANATWTLPTANVNVGYYKFVLSDGNQTVTIWRTLIHAKDYSSTTLPFNYSWQNVNYTLEGRTLTAQSFNDILTLTYPKIPFQYSVNFLVNNMTFLIRLSGSGWAVDIVYMALYMGLKWTINGTLDNPVTFDFQCSTNPLSQWKTRLNQWKSMSMLTFDWEDLAKLGQAFTWNQTINTLTVTIPSTFSIDPYIFSDGFESGNFGAWTGTAGTPSIVTSPVNSGTYAADINASGDYIYQSFSSATVMYARIYVYFKTLPSASGIGNILSFYLGGAVKMRTYLYNDGGTYKIYVSDIGSQFSTGIDFVTGKWYYWEIKWDSDADNYGVWLNGTRYITLTTSSTSSIDTLFVGAISDTWTNYFLIFDDAVIDSSYIGPLTTGPTAYTFQLAENLFISGTAYKSMGLAFQATSTMLLYATGTMNKAIAFIGTNTLNLWASVSRSAALGFQVSDILRLWDNATATFQLSAAKWLNFTLGALLTILDSTNLAKALEFQGTGILRLWDNSTMNKAVWIGAFEIFNAISIVASAFPTFTTSTSSGAAFALAGLAFIIGLCAFGGIFLLGRRRQD